MPRLFVCGDTHGDISTMYKLVERYENDNGRKVDGVVQVGDFGVYPTYTEWHYFWDGITVAPKPTLVIMGNHEDPEAVSDWVSQPDRVENIRLLGDGEITNFLGVSIGGVWGNYSPISYNDPSRVSYNRKTFNSHRIAMHIDAKAVDRLFEQEVPIDILVTHDSAKLTFPSSFGPMENWVAGELGLRLEEKYHAQGCPGFDDLIRKFKPKKYFFGHLHIYEQTRVGGTEATCLQATQYSSTQCFEIVEF